MEGRRPRRFDLSRPAHVSAAVRSSWCMDSPCLQITKKLLTTRSDAPVEFTNFSRFPFRDGPGRFLRQHERRHGVMDVLCRYLQSVVIAAFLILRTISECSIQVQELKEYKRLFEVKSFLLTQKHLFSQQR